MLLWPCWATPTGSGPRQLISVRPILWFIYMTCSSVRRHHGDGGGSGRTEGDAALSFGRRATERGGGVLGAGPTVALQLSQCCHQHEGRPGDLQEVLQVRGPGTPGHGHVEVFRT